MSKHSRPRRHSYAVWYAYRDAMSAGDILAQFDTAAERNDFCERMNARASGSWEPVTLAAVRHRFDPRSFGTDAEHELNGVRTNRDQCVFYIHQRPRYQL